MLTPMTPPIAQTTELRITIQDEKKEDEKETQKKKHRRWHLGPARPAVWEPASVHCLVTRTHPALGSFLTVSHPPCLIEGKGGFFLSFIRIGTSQPFYRHEKRKLSTA